MTYSVHPTGTVGAAAFERLGKRYFLICCLFLLPTLGLVFQAINRHLSMSSLVMHAWQGQGWLDLGLGGGLEGILLSVLLYALIACCAMLFLKGIRSFQDWKTDTDTEEDARYYALLRWTAILAMVLALVIPFHSKDLYAYINYGAEQVLYGLNPYTVPVAMLKDWSHHAIFHPNWVNYPCNYGFVFILLTRLLVTLSGGHFFACFLLFKLLNVGVHVTVTALIYELSKSLKLKNPWFNAYLYGLNPFILLHFLANGHNDLLMTLPLLVSFWLLFSLRRFQMLVIPLWALGILVKYAALAAAPALLIYLFQTGELQAIWLGMLAALGLLGLSYLPFQDISFKMFQAHPEWYEIKTQHSWQAMVMAVYHAIEKKYPGWKGMRGTFENGLSGTAWVAYISLWARNLFGALHDSFKEPIQFIRITCLLMVLLILMANRMFHPWYVGLFFPLMLLLPEEDKLRRFGILLTFTQLISFTLLERSEIVSFLPTVLTWAWVYFPWHWKRTQPECLSFSKNTGDEGVDVIDII